MSPDDIFAAQMWPWPDPVIKRDNAGRVLFINAAFLSLYGGRVETWTGQPVMGWPAPNPQGHPYRFETRAGTAPQETIYDWVEVMMADGHALAIARDVTAYQPPAHTQSVPADDSVPVAPPAPAVDSAPAEPLAAWGQAEIATAPPSMTPPPAVRAPAPEQPAPPAGEASAPQAAAPDTLPLAPEPQLAPQPAPQIEPAPPAPAPVSAQVEAPATPAPAPPAADLQGLAKSQRNPAPQVDPAVQMPTQTQTQPQPQAQAQVPAPVTQTPAVETPAPSVQIAAEPAPQPAPKISQEAPKRDFERRALPIENDEAVLGSNWRDAVIARAVGGAISPAPEEEAPAPAPAMPTANEAKSEEPLRILLAEDNAINALLTRTLLEADGCVVETVEDGALAVEAVKNNEYDLILMDMRMPNMDGLEATRKIRAMGGDRADKWPIIALTANAFDDDRNACFDSGMNDFMTKPVSAEELTAMVTQWVAKTREPKQEAMAS